MFSVALLCLLPLRGISGEFLTTSTASNSTYQLAELRGFRKELTSITERFFNFETDFYTTTDDVDARSDVTVIRRKLYELPGALYDLQLKLSASREETVCGRWELGMNLNPADGHDMHYLEGWTGDADFGSVSTALSRDFIDRSAYQVSN